MMGIFAIRNKFQGFLPRRFALFAWFLRLHIYDWGGSAPLTKDELLDYPIYENHVNETALCGLFCYSCPSEVSKKKKSK